MSASDLSYERKSALTLFLRHSETAETIKPKLFYLKDTSLRRNFQVIVVHYNVSCYYGSEVKKGTYEIFTPKESDILNNLVIFTDIELKFGLDTIFESLSLKSNIRL